MDAITVASDNGIAVRIPLTDRRQGEHFAHALHKPDGMIPALSDADVGDYRAMLGAAHPLANANFFPMAAMFPAR